MGDAYDIAVVWWKPLLCIALMSLLPGAIAYVALRAVHEPAALSWALVSTGVVLLLFLIVVIQLVTLKVRFQDDGLEVGSGVYRVVVPYEKIVVHGVRGASRANEIPQLKWRTNGIGLPGFALGWFRSTKGRVFAVVADSRSAVYIPTTMGYDVMLTPKHEESFLVEVRRRSGLGE